MVCPRNKGRIVLSVLLIMLAYSPGSLLASDGWKKVAVTKQNDLWYVDQTIGFSSRGSVVSTRALIKFVPGPKSIIGQDVRKGLLADGVDATRFSYFVEAVEVDCKKGLLSISKIDFFDSEDVRFYGNLFNSPKYYPAHAGSAYGIISSDLCQIRPDPFASIKNTLKSKKPFLYFYP